MTGNFDKPLTERMNPDGSVVSLRAYELAGGYQAIRKVLRTGMTPMAVIEEVKEAKSLGILGVILFGIPERKDEVGSEAYAKDGIIQKALRAIKQKVDGILVITDVCLCEYTSH